MSNLNKASVSSVLLLAACFSFAGDASSAHESEPEPVARIVYRGNSPFVELNGKLHEPIFNICQVGDQYNESAIVRLSEKGFDIVQLNFVADDFYKGDGRPYNFTLVSNRVSRLLEINPDAYVVISPRFIMKSWAQAHPDEQVGYETGAANPDATDEFRSRVLRPSPASDMFRELVVDMIEKLGEYVSTQPWRKRMYMYHTGTNGSHTITFSDDIVKVRELFTGEVYNSNVVMLTADGPSTWLFRAVSANSVPIGELLSGDAAVSRFPERLREMGLHTAKWMQLTNGVEYYYGRFSDLLGNVDGFTGSRNDLHMLRIDYARAPVKMKFVDHTQTYTKRWTTSKTAAQHNALFAVNMTMEDGGGRPQGYAKADGAVILNGSEASHVTDGFAFNDDKTFKFDMRWLDEDPATGRAKADAWENVVTHEAYTVHNGVAAFGAGATYFSRHNYAFFGTMADGVLWVCTVDGRCDDSEGLGYHEVAALQVELGCTEGICCDGGGSTTMAIRKDLMTVPDICATQKTSRDSAEYYTMNYLSGRQVMGINVGAGQEREVINQLLFVESPDDPPEGGCFCIIFR